MYDLFRFFKRVKKTELLYSSMSLETDKLFSAYLHNAPEELKSYPLNQCKHTVSAGNKILSIYILVKADNQEDNLHTVYYNLQIFNFYYSSRGSKYMYINKVVVSHFIYVDKIITGGIEERFNGMELINPLFSLTSIIPDITNFDLTVTKKIGASNRSTRLCFVIKYLGKVVRSVRQEGNEKTLQEIWTRLTLDISIASNRYNNLLGSISKGTISDPIIIDLLRCKNSGIKQPYEFDTPDFIILTSRKVEDISLDEQNKHLTNYYSGQYSKDNIPGKKVIPMYFKPDSQYSYRAHITPISNTRYLPIKNVDLIITDNGYGLVSVASEFIKKSTLELAEIIGMTIKPLMNKDRKYSHELAELDNIFYIVLTYKDEYEQWMDIHYFYLLSKYSHQSEKIPISIDNMVATDWKELKIQDVMLIDNKMGKREPYVLAFIAASEREKKIEVPKKYRDFTEDLFIPVTNDMPRTYRNHLGDVISPTDICKYTIINRDSSLYNKNNIVTNVAHGEFNSLVRL